MLARRWKYRVSGTDRPAGKDSRLPDRAWRDRNCPESTSGCAKLCGAGKGRYSRQQAVGGVHCIQDRTHTGCY